MGPFDPDALVAMLRSFYPAPSGAAFVQARRERPDSFAGGVVFGSKSDKLRLPDGREFDCIVAAGGPPSGRAWVCVPIDPDDPGVDDPFALEEGPLTFVDEYVELFPGGDPSFESIVTRELGAPDGADRVLDAAAVDVVNAADPDRLDGTYRALVEPAAAAHVNLRMALDGDDPGDVIDATFGHDPEIEKARGDYVEPVPPDTAEVDPGEPPGDTEPPKEPPPF